MDNKFTINDLDSISSQYKETNEQYGKLNIEISELDKLIDNVSSRKEKNLLITDKEKLQIQAKAAKESLSKILNLYFKQLIIVPGDESKFEYLTGIPVEVVDLDIPNRCALIVEKKGSRSHKSFEESDNYGTHISLLLENKILNHADLFFK